MAVNLGQPGELFPVKGVRLATAASGMRYSGREDLLLMAFDKGTHCAAVFTQSKCSAAPVFIAKEHLSQGETRALVINAGNANAATGQLGLDRARQCCAMVAAKLGVDVHQVLPFSTGVIGEQMNMSAFEYGLDQSTTAYSEHNWLAAAKAIMTTDTIAKAVSKQVDINGELITITGISKGSGMICPDMATMLAFVATDAKVDQACLDSWLKRGVNQSFNRITVDSDTSTNDALVLAATGQAQKKNTNGEDQEPIYRAIEQVLIELATAISRAAEGASKFVTIEVNNGASEADCKAVAYSIAHSPLVKTALYASDPNWGRIIMALGKAPAEQLELDKVDIRIGEVDLIVQGQPAKDYTEERGKAVFEQKEITISFDLNQGNARYQVWTSDLSHDYVSINADYRS